MSPSPNGNIEMESARAVNEKAKSRLLDHPNVNVSHHPILSHKTSVLRSVTTDAPTFRRTLRSITFHLGYEATSVLLTKPVPITIPSRPDDVVQDVGYRLTERICLIPILRSGLGMVEPLLELLPDADVHHIGMYRGLGKNSIPVQYYSRLPKQCDADIAYVLDPLVATSGTMSSVIGLLKRWGVPKIHIISVIGSRAGVNDLLTSHPDVSITLACVDPDLSEEGLILPGLGDAGDRLFGTRTRGIENELDEDTMDEALVHPSKRKYSDAGL